MGGLPVLAWCRCRLAVRWCRWCCLTSWCWLPILCWGLAVLPLVLGLGRWWCRLALVALSLALAIQRLGLDLAVLRGLLLLLLGRVLGVLALW